jgi:hypothetical protein
MMAVTVVRVPGCSGLGRKRALLFFSGLEHEAQNARTDHK